MTDHPVEGASAREDIQMVEALRVWAKMLFEGTWDAADPEADAYAAIDAWRDRQLARLKDRLGVLSAAVEYEQAHSGRIEKELAQLREENEGLATELRIIQRHATESDAEVERVREENAVVRQYNSDVMAENAHLTEALEKIISASAGPWSDGRGVIYGLAADALRKGKPQDFPAGERKP
jgi:hypothetical protein